MINLQNYRRANGILCCFDVSQESQFDMLSAWMADMAQKKEQHQKMLMVGIKKSTGSKRVVKYTRACQLAKVHRIKYFEVSIYNEDDERAWKECIEQLIELSYEAKIEYQLWHKADASISLTRRTHKESARNTIS